MDCSMEDCSNRGICNGNKKYFACLCFKPYYGRRCEHEYVEVDQINLLAHKPKDKSKFPDRNRISVFCARINA